MRARGLDVSEPIERSLVGPREVRIGLRDGDVLTVSRGRPNPLLESPLRAAMYEIAALVEANQPKRGDEWRLQSIDFHVASAIAHLGERAKATDAVEVEDNLLHAATRLVMALQIRGELRAGAL